MEQRKALVVEAAIEGEKTRGTSGVVLLVTQPVLKAVYSLLHELPSEELREKVSELLTEDGNEYVYVLEGERTQDEMRNVHIWKMSRLDLIA